MRKFWLPLLISVCLLFWGPYALVVVQGLQIDTPPPGEADLIQLESSTQAGGWVIYQQGPSTHLIRVAAISAILDMGQGGRSTIYFSGGKLQTDHSVKEWIRIYEEEQREPEPGSDPADPRQPRKKS